MTLNVTFFSPSLGLIIVHESLSSSQIQNLSRPKLQADFGGNKNDQKSAERNNSDSGGIGTSIDLNLAELDNPSIT